MSNHPNLHDDMSRRAIASARARTRARAMLRAQHPDGMTDVMRRASYTHPDNVGDEQRNPPALTGIKRNKHTRNKYKRNKRKRNKSKRKKYKKLKRNKSKRKKRKKRKRNKSKRNKK